MTRLPLAALALLATVATVPAHAATFEFAGVTFTDGATVTGSFDTDAAFTTVTSFSVVSGPGRIGTIVGTVPTTGRTYSSLDSRNTAILSALGISFRRAADPGFLGFLQAGSLNLNFGGPLSGNGAAIAGGSETRFLASRAISAGGSANIVGAPVAAVPEPATWGMMILGFGAMGFAMRRRAKVRTNVSFA